MTTKKDLWGDIKNFDSLSLPYPYIFLKEQGDLLREKTNGLLIGEVVLLSSINQQSYESLVNKFNKVNQTDSYDLLGQSEKKYPADFSALLTPKFDYLFKIIVPDLDNYNYYILEVQHNSNIYPVIITDLTTGESQTHKCENQEQFEDVLASILSSSQVKQTIFLLLEEVKENS